MKYWLLLLALLALPHSLLAQTDSCQVFLDQFSDHFNANDHRKAAISLNRYIDCYRYKVRSVVEEDTLLFYWTLIGHEYELGKEPELARQSRQRVLNYYEANPNPVFLQNYTASLSQQIQQYFLASKRTECLQLGERMYAIPLSQLQATNIKKVFYYASGLRYSWTMLRREGRLLLAEQYANRLLTVLKALHIDEDLPEFQRTLRDLGTTKQDMGDFAEAERIFQKLYDQLLKSPKQSTLDWAGDLALIQGSRLAQIKESMGQAEQSELLIRQCLNTIDSILLRYNIPDSTQARKTSDYNVLLKLHAGVFGRLGQAIEDRGEPEEALPVYIKSLAELDSVSLALSGAKKTEDYIRTLSDIGTAYAKLGKYAEANNYIRRSLAIADTVLGTNSFRFAQAQLQTYSSEWGKRQRKEAIDRCRESINHPEAPKNEAYSLMLSQYSSVLLANGLYKQADSVLTVAWTTTKTRYPYVSDMTQRIASKKLLTTINLHQFHSADSLFGKLLTLNRTLLLNRFLGLTEGEKQRLLEKNSYRNQFATYALKRLKENPALADTLYNQQLDYKGILLWSSRKVQAAIRQSSDSSLRATFGAYQRIRQQLAVVSSLTEQQRRGLRVDSLERAANELEKELVIQLPGFANQRAHYTWQHVQSRLRPGQAALEMVRFQQYQFDSAGRSTDTVRYAALLLKPGFTHPKVILLANGNQLETTWLSEWQQHILRKQPDNRSYGRYWQAIVRELTGVKRLYFSPDGIYHQLNPASLFNPATHRYVLDELALTLLTTTRDMAQPGSKRVATPNALLMGFPSYTLSLGKRDSLLLATTNTLNTRSLLPDFAQPALTRGEVWQPLPGTKREVEQIGAMLSQKQYQTLVLTGDQALEGTLKAKKNPNILHLATHAFFKSDTSRRLLGSQNPMLRAGLILAGAQQRDTTLATLLNPTATNDDGVLTALEATDLPLDSTQLVVLSACQTGVGVVRMGEGVYGLQRAFRMAGARAILMSLWRVNDAATQRLMTLFYQHWLAGQSKTEALRQAQQQLRQQQGYASPYYWGAFVLVGE